MPELEHVANGMACLNSLVENMCEMNDQILMDPMEKMLADIKRSKELKVLQQGRRRVQGLELKV
eukprot:55391-Rhodomonas_salina.1